MTDVPGAAGTPCGPGATLLGIDVTDSSGGTPGGASRRAGDRAEREQAIRDLIEDGTFRPYGVDAPFLLRVERERAAVRFKALNAAGDVLRRFAIDLPPLQTWINDDRALVRAHLDAAQTGDRIRLEAIGQARGSLHDEAAGELERQLRGAVALDRATARRVFTLICALDWRS